MAKNIIRIKRALISVFDKTNIVEFASQLHSLGIEIISTGGTSKLLLENKVPVINIEDITKFPEILGGRVKTLHPNIYGGILSRLDNDQDSKAIKNHNITEIDLVVVNLYPFQKAMESNNNIEEIIEPFKSQHKILLISDENENSSVISEKFELTSYSFLSSCIPPSSSFQIISPSLSPNPLPHIFQTNPHTNSHTYTNSLQFSRSLK